MFHHQLVLDQRDQKNKRGNVHGPCSSRPRYRSVLGAPFRRLGELLSTVAGEKVGRSVRAEFAFCRGQCVARIGLRARVALSHSFYLHLPDLRRNFNLDGFQYPPRSWQLRQFYICGPILSICSNRSAHFRPDCRCQTAFPRNGFDALVLETVMFPAGCLKEVCCAGPGPTSTWIPCWV